MNRQLYCQPTDPTWTAPLNNPFVGPPYTTEWLRARDGLTRREMNAGIPYGAAYALGSDMLLHLTPLREIPPGAPFMAS